MTISGMQPPYLITLDQGTTSCRCLAFDSLGRQAASAQLPIRQFYPQPGWVEEDAEEILAVQIAVLRAVVDQLAVSPSAIAGLGLTNQRETVVLWDRETGRPVHPAIVWQCRRTAAICDQLRQDGLEPWIRDKTGLVLDAYFSATKFQWIFQQNPDLRERAARGELLAGTVDTWLIWHLSGRKAHVTDVSNASRTLLMNLQTGQWDPELLDLFGLPAAMLPRIVPSAGIFATLDSAIVPGGLPLAGLAGDQQAALFGQACFEPGLAKNTYGTGCFILMQTGSQPVRSSHGLLTTVAWDLGRGTGLTYALEGSVFNAGSAIQWLRDGLGLFSKASDCDSLAATVPDTAGVHMVPAFTGLGAPYWDMQARGMLTGLTRGTGKAHIARAVLEAIAFQSQDVLDCMAAEAGRSIPTLRVDGGACVSDLLMQFQADISNLPVDRPVITETTAFGAAALAGLGLDVWPDLATVAAQRRCERLFVPTMPDAERRQRQAAWRQAVAAARQYGRGGL